MTNSYWDLDSALTFIREHEEALRKLGWCLGLTGSILLKGQSKKDLDLILFPANNGKVDREALYELLEEQGLRLQHTSIVVHQAWQRQGSSDRKHVEVWRTLDGRRIDFFFLS